MQLKRSQLIQRKKKKESQTLKIKFRMNTTLKEVKEKISENIPLDLKDFFF